MPYGGWRPRGYRKYLGMAAGAAAYSMGRSGAQALWRGAANMWTGSRSRNYNSVVPGYTRRSGYYGKFTGRRGFGPPELKFCDTHPDEALSNIQTIFSLDSIPQGVLPTQRIGERAMLRQLSIRGHLKLPASNDANKTQIVCRMLIVLDTQCNGADPQPTDILETDSVYQHYQTFNRGRFRILYDKLHTLNAQAGNVTTQFGADTKGFTITLNRLNIPVMFSGSTGNTTEKKTNHLMLVTYAQQNDVVNLDCRTRVLFAG